MKIEFEGQSDREAAGGAKAEVSQRLVPQGLYLSGQNGGCDARWKAASGPLSDKALSRTREGGNFLRLAASFALEITSRAPCPKASRPGGLAKDA